MAAPPSTVTALTERWGGDVPEELPAPAPVRSWLVVWRDGDTVTVARTTRPDRLTGRPYVACPADAMVEAAVVTALSPWRVGHGRYRWCDEVAALFEALRVVQDHSHEHDDARAHALAVSEAAMRRWVHLRRT